MSNFVVFDFETSGLVAASERIIEVAAIRVEDGQVVQEFSTVVNPKMDKPLPERITNITGITQEDVDNGMEEKEAFDKLRSMIDDDSILVAHNASFDIQFMHHTFMRLYQESVVNPIIDTLTMSRAKHVYPHKLEDMCARFNITLTGAHRALNDVIGCWELLQALDKQTPKEEWVNKVGYLKKYGPPAWAPSYVTLVPMVNQYAR